MRCDVVPFKMQGAPSPFPFPFLFWRVLVGESEGVCFRFQINEQWGSMHVLFGFGFGFGDVDDVDVIRSDQQRG